MGVIAPQRKAGRTKTRQGQDDHLAYHGSALSGLPSLGIPPESTKRRPRSNMRYRRERQVRGGSVAEWTGQCN